MATLNETAHYSRLMIKYGAIALVVMIVGRFFLGIASSLALVLFPPEPAPPTVGFGALPVIDFPRMSSGEYSYSLQTADGNLPSVRDRAEVYPMQVMAPNLLALERANQVAERLGFEDEPEQVSQTEYRWSVNEGVPGRLEMNIYTGSFEIRYDWNSVGNFLSEKRLIAAEDATERVKDVLDSADLLEADLRNGYYQTTYLQASGRNFRRTVSLSEADFVQYDFFRQPLGDEEYEAVTPDPEKGVVRAVVSNYPQQFLISLEYNYFPTTYDDEETYPIKNAAVAWQELQAGRGYVANLDEGIENVVVRRINLGYYDAFTRQDYLQPVFVFRGDDNFVAYVPAVVDSLIERTTDQPGR